jgi:hypothetical protein
MEYILFLIIFVVLLIQQFEIIKLNEKINKQNEQK